MIKVLLLQMGLTMTILDRYPTAHALRQAYLGAGSRDACLGLLAPMKLRGTGLRSIGPVVSARVFTSFFGQTIHKA